MSAGYHWGLLRTGASVFTPGEPVVVLGAEGSNSPGPIEQRQPERVAML